MAQLLAAIAVFAGFYAFVIAGWNDALRLVQGARHVWATVERHELGPDGYVPVYVFIYAERTQSVRGPVAHAFPKPAIGTRSLLSFPARRPDLARPRQTFARTLMYLAFAAWFTVFSDMWLRWL